MKIKHNLMVLMAQREIKSLSELSRMTKIPYQTLYNFKTYIHKKIDPDLTSTLCQTLECDIGDLYYLDKSLVESGKSY